MVLPGTANQDWVNLIANPACQLFWMANGLQVRGPLGTNTIALPKGTMLQQTSQYNEIDPIFNSALHSMSMKHILTTGTNKELPGPSNLHNLKQTTPSS
jgi:hypothetical protein